MSHEQNEWVLLAHGRVSVHQPLGGGGGGGKKLPTSSPLQTEQGNSNGGNNSEETKPVNSQKKWQKNTRGNPPLQREGEM